MKVRPFSSMTRTRIVFGVISGLQLLLHLSPFLPSSGWGADAAVSAADEQKAISSNTAAGNGTGLLDIKSISDRAKAFPMCDGSLQCNRFRYSYQGDCGNLAKPVRGRWCRPDYDMDAVCCGDSPLDCCVLNGGGIMVTMLVMILMVGTVTILACSCCTCCPYHGRLNKKRTAEI
jgi:hypothetical protein